MGNVHSDDLKHDSWFPKCCRAMAKNQQMFGFNISADQQKARQWIDRSIVPSYQPCMNCATDLIRRYNDPHRTTVLDLINWDKLDTLDIRVAFEIGAGGSISIKDLSVKNMVQVGYTCGASDFVDSMMRSSISGKKFCEYIVNNSKPWNGSDVLLPELDKVLLLLNKLRLIDLQPITTTFIAVKNGQISHEFINNKNEFGSKAYGMRLKKSGAIFGYRGAKDGTKGQDCGGKQAACAKIGKEKGGRKKGGKNVFSLTIELSNTF